VTPPQPILILPGKRVQDRDHRHHSAASREPQAASTRCAVTGARALSPCTTT